MAKNVNRIPKKDLSKELKLVEELVYEGKTDNEIAEKMNCSLAKIYKIRVCCLGIKNLIRQKRCICCGKNKNIKSFSLKHSKDQYKDWCLSCRRKNGIDICVLKKLFSSVKKSKPIICYKKFRCLRCNRVFESLVWGKNQHYHMCDLCRSIIATIDRASI